MPNSPDNAITVLELNQRLSNAIAVATDVHDVWVIGETSDMRTSGGHCYFELIEKGDDGSNRSRIRATIWANKYRKLQDDFQKVGLELTSNIKICARVNASYHPTYGMAVNVVDINASYTAGDAMRLRREIVLRLEKEGIINSNKNLGWSLAPNRIAVISARGAAGYGDFITHLLSNQNKLRFHVSLHEAVMQGARTAPTIIEALEKIKQNFTDYDAVVLIRGGGSTADLAAFDNYDLASAIARFPLPVVIGIGHERDITVLDYVANMRVKTPTAAAEFLIERVSRLMDALGRAADRIYLSCASRIASSRELLAHAEASIPGMVRQNILRRSGILQRYALTIASTVSTTVSSRSQRLDRFAADIVSASRRTAERAADRLERAEALLRILSPEATLARGFSLTTLPDGHVVTKASQAPAGTKIVTHLASGSLTSTVKDWE